MSKLKITVVALATLAAGPALAGGCNSYGMSHPVTASVAVEPAEQTDTLVATLDCATLSGDAQASCLAAQSAE